MKEFKEEVLIKSGLTKNESKVYLALLKLGSGTAIEITKQSKVHRVNVYDVLERLLGKGLIGTVIQAKKKIYEIADPQQLIKLIQAKEESLKKIMPFLSEEFKSKKQKQNVYHFFGPEGVMQAYYMMFDQNHPIIYALGGSGLNRKYLKHRHEMWNKERIAKGIKGKMIYYEFTRNDKERGWNHPMIDIKYIPDKYKTLGMIDICGNLIINLVPVEDNIMAIVIENKTLAESYKQFFEFIWEHAKK